MARMLCIKGRQNPAHTGIVSGQVYEVSIVKPCCSLAAHAEGSVFKVRVRLRCKKCGRITRGPMYVPWGPERFVPWQHVPKVSRKEVQALYKSDLKHKEKKHEKGFMG